MSEKPAPVRSVRRTGRAVGIPRPVAAAGGCINGPDIHILATMLIDVTLTTGVWQRLIFDDFEDISPDPSPYLMVESDLGEGWRLIEVEEGGLYHVEVGVQFATTNTLGNRVLHTSRYCDFLGPQSDSGNMRVVPASVLETTRAQGLGTSSLSVHHLQHHYSWPIGGTGGTLNLWAMQDSGSSIVVSRADVRIWKLLCGEETPEL